MVTLLPGAPAWTPLASLPRPTAAARASVVRGRIRLSGGSTFSSLVSDSTQVLEYHPAPWDQWVDVGDILVARDAHAVLSLGHQQLLCSGQCPALPPSPGNLCVPPAGNQVCLYDGGQGGTSEDSPLIVTCCCGRCPDDVTCAPDSITGSGLWQSIAYSPLCPTEGCGTNGVITSPNHPASYPNNLKKTENVTVKKGKIMRLEFTAFAVYVGGSITTCPTDFVRITDGDGTTLMDNICGYSDRDPSSSLFFQPPIITSKTNKVEIYFHTNYYYSARGWSLRWTAVAEGSVCPSPSPPTPGQPCSQLPGVQDCHYNGNQGGSSESPLLANCCCGRCDTDMTCTPGSGIWQPMYSPLCPTEGCGTEGVITSTNHPADYPNNLEMTQHISVRKGKILRLEFTAFAVDVWRCSVETCSCDFVRVTDGDGTTLMDNSCGYLDRDPSNSYYFQPPIITSKTNKVEIYFHTNDWGTTSGWSLRWTAVAEGA